MNYITLKIFHVEDEVRCIINPLSTLEIWLDKAGIGAAELVKSTDENAFNVTMKDIETHSSTLTWYEIDCDTSFKLQVDVCNDINFSKNHIEKQSDYDIFLLDAYVNDGVQKIAEYAKGISGFIRDPKTDVRIYTSYIIELAQEVSEGQDSNNLLHSVVPASWGWPNSENLLIKEILFDKNNQEPPDIEDEENIENKILYRWLYKMIKSKFSNYEMG